MRQKTLEDAPNDEHCRIIRENILFSALFKVNLPPYCVAKVVLPVDKICKRWRARILNAAPSLRSIVRAGRDDFAQRTKKPRQKSVSGGVAYPVLKRQPLCVPSKSAMNVFAPLFSAFITIFLSGGPVISTRLSSRPGAGGAQCHAGSARMCAVSGGKSSASPASRRCCVASRARRSSRRVASNVR